MRMSKQMFMNKSVVYCNGNDNDRLRLRENAVWIKMYFIVLAVLLIAISRKYCVNSSAFNCIDNIND